MDEENEFSRDVYIETLAHESRNNSQLQTYTNFANTKGGYMKQVDSVNVMANIKLEYQQYAQKRDSISSFAQQNDPDMTPMGRDDELDTGR